jgi:hypothetical protein
MPDGAPQPLKIPASFKMVFLVIAGFTLLCLLCIAGLAFFGEHALKEADIPVFQRNLYSSCSFGWQAGLGAILGLIGGKVTQ